VVGAEDRIVSVADRVGKHHAASVGGLPDIQPVEAPGTPA